MPLSLVHQNEQPPEQSPGPRPSLGGQHPDHRWSSVRQFLRIRGMVSRRRRRSVDVILDAAVPAGRGSVARLRSNAAGVLQAAGQGQEQPVMQPAVQQASVVCLSGQSLGECLIRPELGGAPA